MTTVGYFQGIYSPLLLEFCRHGGEGHLRQAAELGWEYADRRFSPSDIVTAHRQAISVIERDQSVSAERAFEFLAEVLIGYGQSTNERANQSAREEINQRRHSLVMESMQQIAEILSGRASFLDKCEAVLRLLVDLVPADLVTLRRPDETGYNMILIGHASQVGFPYEPPSVVTNQALISFRAFTDKNIEIINDYVSNSDAYQGFVDIGVRSTAFLPKGSQGTFFGLFYIISKEVNHFTPDWLRLLYAIRDGLGVLFENADLYAQISEELDQRRQVQADLAESESRCRMLGESTADILWEMDPKGTYTYCSPNVESITGYGPGELIGSSQYDFMPPDETERVRNIFSDLASDGKDISLMEYTFINRDGSHATIERNGTPILA
jgi:PAS domain S-box-containing protein